MAILPVSVDDVDAATRGMVDTGDTDVVKWVASLLDKAERKLILVCPSLRMRVAADDTLALAAADIVVDAVARVVRTGEDEIGFRSESEDGYSYTRDPLVKSADIWFPDKDIKLLGCGSEGFVPRSAGLARGTVWAGY